MAKSSQAKPKSNTKARNFYKQAGRSKKQLFQPKKRTTKSVSMPEPEAASKPTSTPPPPPSPETPPSPPANPPLTDTPSSSDPGDIEKQELERTIEQSVARIAHTNKLLIAKQKELDQATQQASAQPDEINGLSSPDEQFELLSQEIRNYQRKISKLNHELDVIKKDFDKEKKTLKQTISGLRQELHRTAPLHDRKYFSLSQEVKSAIEEIESNADGPIDLESVSTDTLTQAPTPALTPPNNLPLTTPSSATTTKPNQPPNPASTQPKRKDKKLLITGIVLLFLLISGAAVSFQVMSQPTVDPDLVSQYLESGQVQGASADNQAPKVDRYAEIPFEATQWEGFEDPFYGIRFRYPANVTEKQKSGNGIAFLRKDGYLFKFQHIASQLGIQEYWEQTQPSDVEYQVTEVEFKGQPSLRLVLSEEVEYPGERYLVKHNDGILELWFPAESNKFSADDMQRVDKIIESISFF